MFTIHCDGAYSKTHDVGAYAGLIQDGPAVKPELVWGRTHKTTSQRMELVAVIASLRGVQSGRSGPVYVYTDSEYIVKGISGEYQLQANLDLWDLLTAELTRLKSFGMKVSVSHLSRNSTPELERCDTLAKRATDPKANGPDFTPLGRSLNPVVEESVKATKEGLSALDRGDSVTLSELTKALNE